MARSRLQEWREEYQRRRTRFIIIASVTLFLLVIFLVYRWYISVHQSFWDKRDLAVTQAVYAGQLDEVLSAEPYNGEQSWFIVRGLDEDGEEVIVWVSEEQSIVKGVDEGISPARAKSIVQSRYEGANIIRMTPGVWRQELCYEVYYRIHHPDGDIYYYDYIRFEDGAWLETLRLGR